MISDFYLGTHAPSFPTRSFTNKSEALAFLKTVMALVMVFSLGQLDIIPQIGRLC